MGFIRLKISQFNQKFFNPLKDTTGQMEITVNTRSIHWYSKSWLSKKEILRSKITRLFNRLFWDCCLVFLKKKDEK